MPAKKSSRLEPVVRVTEAREQRAARALGQAQSELQVQQARLDELLKYQAEYQQRFQETGRAGTNAQQMRSFNVFLANITKAIEQQKRLIEIARHAVEEKKQQWFSKRTRTQAINTVVDSYREVERRESERREQHESDERGQRMGRNKI